MSHGDTEENTEKVRDLLITNYQLSSILMSIQFRKLKPAESQQYRETRLESLKNYPNSFGSSYEMESARPKLAFEISIEQQSDTKFIVGAFDKEKLAGICGFVQEEGIKTCHRGLIIQMYIRPEYQGRKLGLQLIQTTIDLAFQLPVLEQIVLGVITNNEPAKRIYEQAGFKPFGLHPHYLKVGNDYFDEQLMVIFKSRS